MARRSRRIPARPLSAPAPLPPSASSVIASGREIPSQGGVVWRAALVGLVVGEVSLLLLSNLGIGVANAALGNDGRADGGVVGVASLLAVLLGGFIAARIAGRAGLYQGMTVGIGFILVGAFYQFLAEQQQVHLSLISGSHLLIDLGPMNMGSLLSGDILALFGGSVGGLLARRR